MAYGLIATQRACGILVIALACPGLASAQTVAQPTAHQKGPRFTWYGSLRMQVEAVKPDVQGAFERYTGLRDAYSRAGVQAHHTLGPGWALLGQLELPVDTANLRVQDPYDQGDSGGDNAEHLRIARVGLTSPHGTWHFGQQWMPYYNAISAPLDRFSSYYSGFATYTVFRVAKTLAYVSPTWRGLSFSLAHAPASGNRSSTSRIDDRRLQATASGEWYGITLAAGIDDRGSPGAGHDRLQGLSMSHRRGPWYVALKYERFDTDELRLGAFNRDGNEAINAIGTWDCGPLTLKLMLARVASYGEGIVHMGIDHRIDDKLTLFAEFYRESTTAALTAKRKGLSAIDSAAQGGRVVALGLRYDF